MYLTLGLVASVMTLINIITQKGWLTFCTALFAVLCFLNVLLVSVAKKERGMKIASGLFSVEVIVMFTYFLVTGNPEGFSAIWICMLPSLGLLFFGRLYGSIVCAVMFGDLAFLFWTPIGNDLLQYGYTKTFLARFPILLIAFYLVALFLEILRSYTYEEMKRLEGQYEQLSVQDPLTGVYNRQGMYATLEKQSPRGRRQMAGAAILDIDFFKRVNDEYGHAAGDAALCQLAQLLRETVGENVCRWGGEEFLMLDLNEPAQLYEKMEILRQKVEAHTFRCDETEFRLTVSIGVCNEIDFEYDMFDKTVKEADDALYTAKRSGRNKVIMFGAGVV